MSIYKEIDGAHGGSLPKLGMTQAALPGFGNHHRYTASPFRFLSSFEEPASETPVAPQRVIS